MQINRVAQQQQTLFNGADNEALQTIGIPVRPYLSSENFLEIDAHNNKK